MLVMSLKPVLRLEHRNESSAMLVVSLEQVPRLEDEGDCFGRVGYTLGTTGVFRLEHGDRCFGPT